MTVAVVLYTGPYRAIDDTILEYFLLFRRHRHGSSFSIDMDAKTCDKSRWRKQFPSINFKSQLKEQETKFSIGCKSSRWSTTVYQIVHIIVQSWKTIVFHDKSDVIGHFFKEIETCLYPNWTD